MGTQIQASAFLTEYQSVRSVIDLNGNTRNGVNSLYHDNSIVKNGQHLPDSRTSPMYQNGYLGYDTKIVRQTILKQELIFKNQLQELHRLYRRQQDLMNEMKRREIEKHNVEEEKNQSNTLSTRSDIFPKRTFDLELPADVYMSNVEKQMKERTTNHQVSYDRDTKSSPSNTDSLKFNLFSKSDCNRDNLKDFFQKRRIDEDSAKGGQYSGKSPAFSQSLLAEPRNGISCSPLDTGKSLYRRKRTMFFGVEISEENDDSWDADSNTESTILKKDLINSESSPASWIHNSLKQNLEFGGTNLNNGKSESLKEGLKTNMKWFQGCSSSSIGLEKNSEQSQKFPKTVPQRHLAFSDFQEKPQNPEGGLPWFLRNPQNIDKPNKETNSDAKSSYFMNLDSLKNCSQKFFTKPEKDNSSFQNLKQKMMIQDAEGGINEVNNDTSSKKILGFPISDMLQDSNSGDNPYKANSSGVNSDREVTVKDLQDQLGTNGLDLKKGLNDHISTLRHHIDLNLSLDEEDGPLAPPLPTDIVKIATNEIDLEAPAVIESEPDASPIESNSMKMEVSPVKSEIEESDKDAAEAIIAISLSSEPPHAVVSHDRLKWLAEIISSQNGAASDEEDSILDGMDYFECMTLKLKDTKEENYLYNPMIFNNLSDEETRGGDMFSKRNRKGQSKRGRLRRDFQTEILPGLVTLSRREVTEDLKSFEEVVKAEGRTWNSSKRKKGRGRKRLASPNTAPTVKAHCSTKTQQLVSGELLGFKDGSLTGWGKRTRRVPRQRCNNSSYLSFPVKC